VNRATRNALASLVVQASLLAFAIYVAVSTDAFPGASTAARAGLVAISFGVIFLVQELERLRAQTRALTLMTAGALGGAVPRDDKAAVDVLVLALGSEDPAVREKAHRNLVRLTGEELPADPEAWRSWWAVARDGFVAKGRRS
jgi:hypothetical protein